MTQNAEQMQEHTIFIVAGPTASGKSARALALAKAHDGVIVNCDSLQVYDALPTLTAQPSADDHQTAPHKLYSALHPNDPCSAGHWRERAEPLIEEILNSGHTPIICGGTGLYIKSLTEGLSPMPDIPDHIRQATIEKQKALGNPGFYEALHARDPIMAERFHPFHTARLMRAWEVLEATGKSLAEWQKHDPIAPPDHWHFEIEVIIPERKELHARCNTRFEMMLESGALDEVAALAEQIDQGHIQPDVPITKALGFQELRRYLSGTMSKDEAVARAQAQTRQYAKRQITWFRNQL